MRISSLRSLYRASALSCIIFFAAAAAGSADARNRLGWLDLVTPDRVMTGLAQAAVLGLRNWAEVRYDALSTDFVSGTMVLTGLRVLPFPILSGAGDCALAVDRAAVSGLTPLDIADLSIRIEIIGLETDTRCLPHDMRFALEALGQRQLRVGHARVSVDYSLASGAVEISAHLLGTGLADASMPASLDYLSLREGRLQLEPVVRFREAYLALEDDGLLALVRAFMPPSLSDPKLAATMLRMEIEGDLRRDNAFAQRRLERLRGGDLSGLPAELPLTPAQRRFIDSLDAEVERLLRDGGRIVLTLSAPVGVDNVLLPPDMGNDARVTFELFNPLLHARAPARSAILPEGLLRQALSGPQELPVAERRRAGVALLTGLGAPRDRHRGLELLAPLADAGDGDAAALLARELAGTAPDAAYGFARQAAAQRMPGALATLDRLEAVLPLDRVLEIQGANNAEVTVGSTYESIGAMRQMAMEMVIGIRRPRDYAQAWFWASIAAAAGDTAAAGLRDEIEHRVTARGPEAVIAWAEATAPLIPAMLGYWLDQTLPTRSGYP